MYSNFFICLINKLKTEKKKNFQRIGLEQQYGYNTKNSINHLCFGITQTCLLTNHTSVKLQKKTRANKARQYASYCEVVVTPIFSLQLN